MRIHVPAAIALLLASVGASHAQAPSATIEAEQLFKDGKRLMDAGDYASACEAFEGSLRKDPVVSTRLNLANCREKNQQYASAWGHFIEAARQARSNPAQANLVTVVQERAEQLEPRLSHLIINVADEARVDGLAITRDGEPVDPAIWNRDLPVDGGRYVVAGKAPGYEPWSTTVTVRASGDKQSVNVPRFATAPASDADGDDDGDDGDEPGARPRRTVGALTGERKLALGAWAVGAVGLGAGLALELKSRGTFDDAKASPDNAERHALTDQASRERLYATLAAGVGVAVVATGVYLWIDGAPRRGGDVAVVPAIVDGGVAATLVGSF